MSLALVTVRTPALVRPCVRSAKALPISPVWTVSSSRRSWTTKRRTFRLFLSTFAWNIKRVPAQGGRALFWSMVCPMRVFPPKGFPKNILHLSGFNVILLYRESYELKDVSVVFQSSFIPKSGNQSQPNEKSFGWDWFLIWLRKKVFHVPNDFRFPTRYGWNMGWKMSG